MTSRTRRKYSAVSSAAVLLRGFGNTDLALSRSERWRPNCKILKKTRTLFLHRSSRAWSLPAKFSVKDLPILSFCIPMSSWSGSRTILTQTIAGTFTPGLFSRQLTKKRQRRLRSTHVLKESPFGCTKREPCAGIFAGAAVITSGNGTAENLNYWKKQ